MGNRVTKPTPKAMKALVNEVFELIKDYRADENNPAVMMTRKRVKLWVEQFEKKDRLFLLIELKNIFQKHYCMKIEAKSFLKGTIDVLAKDKGYATPQAFLLDTVFLDLQPAGKSQKKFLALLAEVLKDEFSFDVQHCGTQQRKNFVYLDDILCTGNTLLYGVKDWAGTYYQQNQTYLEAIKARNIELILCYIFIHTKNYHKKVAEIGYKIDKEFRHTIHHWLEIDNENLDATSNLGIALPTETDQSEEVIRYKEQIITEVDNYTNSKGYPTSVEEFYRPIGKPITETFFTSPEARTRFENIMLEKGIKILKKANITKQNIRALGYSLPSQKNFGFGALCFTWRNVPNNTPLAFWYDGGGNFPLFVVNRGKS